MLSKNEFSTLDFTLFVITLVVSLFIGIYNALKNRDRQSTNEVLLAGGNMGVVPVALSLFASFTSSISVIGIPAEVYLFNTTFFWILPALPIATLLSAHVHVPVVYNLHLTSIYEVTIIYNLFFLFFVQSVFSFLMYSLFLGFYPFHSIKYLLNAHTFYHFIKLTLKYYFMSYFFYTIRVVS